MRVLFLTLYPKIAASPRYRVGQFLPYLQQRGIKYTVAPAVTEAVYQHFTGPTRRGRAMWYHLAETPRRLMQLLKARTFDVVFLQKAVMSAYVRGTVPLLRGCAQRLLYDFDDAVHLAPPHPLRAPWRWLEDRKQITALLKCADGVSAGNVWLAETARLAGAHDVVLTPTVVDTDRFVPPSRTDARYRIGWMGSPSTAAALAPIADVLANMEDAEICLIGAGHTASWPWARCRPWSLETEVTDVQSFSVGLMPLPKEEWTKGKCALKALLYMACGVPCVATPYGAVCDIIEHEKNGLFADSPEEWADALVRLRDPEYRRRLGKAARATVEARFALKTAAPRFCDWLESAV